MAPKPRSEEDADYKLALAVSSVGQDVSYIKQQLVDLNKKFEELSATFVAKEEHDNLKKAVEKLETGMATLQQKVYLASGGLAVIVFVLKFLIRD